VAPEQANLDSPVLRHKFYHNYTAVWKDLPSPHFRIIGSYFHQIFKDERKMQTNGNARRSLRYNGAYGAYGSTAHVVESWQLFSLIIHVKGSARRKASLCLYTGKHRHPCFGWDLNRVKTADALDSAATADTADTAATVTGTMAAAAVANVCII
jgi:hypothetical protein